MAISHSAAEIIALLKLEPHPEGGYFLLEDGEISRWHTVDAAETWHWLAGAPLRLSIARHDGGPASQCAHRRMAVSPKPWCLDPGWMHGGTGIYL